MNKGHSELTVVLVFVSADTLETKLHLNYENRVWKVKRRGEGRLFTSCSYATIKAISSF